MFPVTSLYAGLFAMLFAALSLRVSLRRRTVGVAIGDGADKGLAARIRAQGNFAEYVPLFLILLGLAEAGGLSATVLHIVALVMLAGRILHAASYERGVPLVARAISMGATYAIFLGLGLTLLLRALAA